MTQINYYDIIQNRFSDRTIICLSDNGSKTWGFDSPESDNDIKGFYIYNDKNVYNHIYPGIEHSFRFDIPEHNIDCTLFDIKRFFEMVYRGNSQAYEILASPIKYKPDFTHFENEIKFYSNFILENRISTLILHNYNMAKKTYLSFINRPEIKNYLYVIKSIMLCNHLIDGFDKTPPLNFEQLLKYSYANFHINEETYKAIFHILEMKRQNKGFTEFFQRSTCFSTIESYIQTSLDCLSIEAKQKYKDDEYLAQNNLKQFNTQFIKDFFS